MFRVFEMFKMCDSLLVLITWLWALCIVQGSTPHCAPQASCSPEARVRPVLRSVVKIMNLAKWIIYTWVWSPNPSSSCYACLSVSCRILDESNFFFPLKKIPNIPCSYFECLTSYLFCTPSDKFPVETGFVQETLLWKNSDALCRVLRLGQGCVLAGCRSSGRSRDSRVSMWWHLMVGDGPRPVMTPVPHDPNNLLLVTGGQTPQSSCLLCHDSGPYKLCSIVG